MNRNILVLSIAAALAIPSIGFADDSGFMDGDYESIEEQCTEKFDPFICNDPSFFENSGNYAHTNISKDQCREYARKALDVFFEEQPRFASKVHKTGDAYTRHELTFVERDYISDTKSSYGCAMGVESYVRDGRNPFSHVRYSISETYVDGFVIYINDYTHIGVIDF